MTFAQITLRLLGGFGYTLLIFVATLIAALPLGLLISLGSMSKFKPVSAVFRSIVWVVRGTPLMLQIIIFALGPGLWFDIPVREVWMQIMLVCIAFTINYACYFSEIYRAGIESIPKGQYEACQVLGMSKKDTFFKVIFMQVVKRVVPPMSNEIITLVKDTALASVVISVDLFTEAQQIVNKEVILWPLFYAGIFYLAFSGILTLLFGFIEKKLDYYKV